MRWVQLVVGAVLVLALDLVLVFGVRHHWQVRDLRAADPVSMPGRLPVVPKLRPLDESLQPCAIGRGCCWRGYRVKPVEGSDGVVRLRRVQRTSGFVRC